MKIACIGTYPPRVCGIATFTYNLRQSIVEYFNAPSSIFIVAINDNGQTYDYPEEVKFVINQQEQPDYLEAAEFINKSGADVCILEHEFGIFGGDSGIFILSLINNLKIPLIVTFHSVLKTPSFAQKAIIKSIGEHADRIIVMSHKAVDFLSKIYSIPIIKLKIIEHGVPVYKFDQAACKKKLNLENKIVLLTFGLLSNNKGIETVINALPDVVSKHPNVLYIVLGKTHPNVLRHSNEDYRNSLIKLAENHNLKDHILFRNEFVDEKLLFEYLYATDIYITPYLDEAQITSGTLAYAVGTGAAVVSTPYWHAAEILDHERGKLFDFNDYKELSSILNTLISNPRELQKFRNNAAEYGKKTSWPLMGREYIKVCVELSKLKRRASPSEPYYDMTGVPYFNLKHIQVLTDDTGIIQHSKFGVPNLKEGYCLDDNARALLMALMAYQFRKDEMALRLVPTYLKFVNYMQKDDGSFNNFLNFRRELYREDNSEDCFGRTIWSLGYLVRFAPKDAYLQAGKEFLVKATPHIDKLKTMRGIANSLIGISHYLKKFPNDEGLISILRKVSGKLILRFGMESDSKWKWFEPQMSYDNGILPLALLHAYEILRDKTIMSVALESLTFLDQVSFKKGYLSPVGTNGWYPRNGECIQYSQQSIDVMAMVLMYHQAFKMTGEEKYYNRMFQSFKWFLGKNDLYIPLFDHETNGCCDGLDFNGVNRNQGAESSLGYLISHLIVSKTFESYNKKAEANLAITDRIVTGFLKS